MNEIIKPTVGRKVWYRPGEYDVRVDGMAQIEGQPLDATIVGVHSDVRVNLVIFDGVGIMHRRQDVVLLQRNMGINSGSSYAEWMPFQVKAAAREPALDSLVSGIVN